MTNSSESSGTAQSGEEKAPEPRFDAVSPVTYDEVLAGSLTPDYVSGRKAVLRPGVSQSVWWRPAAVTMRIAYLDCFSGISGDMFLGALIGAGVPV